MAGAEGLGDRLRRLRREEARPEREGPPVWLKNRLRAQARRDEVPAPGSAVPTLDGEPSGLVEAGGVAAREHTYTLDARHGDFCLGEVDAVDPGVFTLLTGDEQLATLDPRRAVYLDTETTGLAGGSGTYVYMVGLGTFEGDTFRVWQGFLRGPEEEHALLEVCARRIAAADSVVSFFGKSFDRHRLEDKMRAHGVKPPFDRPHLDLYHPLARLSRGSLPDGRLNTLESVLCGLERKDDLPGSLAPAAWFDYTAGRPHRIDGVFRHNLDDVLSLVTLTAHLGRSLRETRGDGAPLSGCTRTRAQALGQALLARRERAAAIPWLERALERGAERGLDCRDVALELAEALRREGRLDEAIRSYADLVTAADDELSIQGLVGWAKLLEHERRDRAGARTCCQRALALAEGLDKGSRLRHMKGLKHRLARLSEGLDAP